MKTLSEELAAHKERRNTPNITEYVVGNNCIRARYLIPRSIDHVVMKFIINEHDGNK